MNVFHRAAAHVYIYRKAEFYFDSGLSYERKLMSQFSEIAQSILFHSMDNLPLIAFSRESLLCLLYTRSIYLHKLYIVGANRAIRIRA